MPLAPGTKLGPYEIVAPLGAGGMGEVYRARDSRLGRDVAIKVLPEHLSAQPEIRARFEREARTVSGLNHPNICTLFDVGREGETDFLVMELIEGDTLADRLKQGPLTTAELLRLGTQIADALDRAHRAGVVHRDLKPGNVMLARNGAKLMDFGLSRVTGMAGTGGGSGHALAALTASPTMAQALTAEGTLLGTFQYMSPEQLEGKDADARSDIWALGCVLYEMATGRRAFEGRSQASLIAAILERQPAGIGDAPSGTTSVVGALPTGLDRLLRNCLAKDPEERIQTAHDVKLQLQGIAEHAGFSATSVAATSVTGVPIPARGGRGTRLAWAVAAVALLAAAAVAGWAFTRQPAPAAAIRFRLSDVAGATDYFWPRVSPDGRFILLQGTDSSNTLRAFVRPIDQISAVPIPGTEGMRRAYWSPDGREIVFVLGDQIMRAPVGGGSPTVICAAQGGVDLSWGSKGKLLMDGRFIDSLRVVDAGGGEMRPATRIYREDGEVGSGWPCFLPDGEHFLFTGNLNSSAGRGNIRLGKLGSLESKKLGTTDGRVEYAPGGWVLFLRGKTLLAQKLDLGGGKLVGEPVTLADGVRLGTASGHFSVSPTGVLAFSRETGGDAVTLREVNRTGANVGTPILSGLISNPQLSPDGQRMLYLRLTSGVGTDGDVSVFDLARGTDTKLTFSGGTAATPVWSPDGQRFAYVTRPIGAAQRIRIASADGMGAVDSIETPDRAAGSLTDWSSARARLLYSTPDFRPYEVAVEGAAPSVTPLIDSLLFRGHARISPDGRWLAFVQGAPPNIHVFVQTLEGSAGRWQISTAPAVRPRWVRGGRGLVFEGLDGRLMEVDIDTSAGFRPGTPRPMFALPVGATGPELFTWSCDPAGERFFVLVPPTTRSKGIVEVVSDFASLVNRRRP